MGAKRFRLSQGFLIAVVLYAGFISVLYVRLRNAEKEAAEYASARLCILPSNCREIVAVEVLDHALSKVAFRNYGPKGIPLERGSFQKYVFVVSSERSENKTVYILPNVPLSSADFDLANVYLPAKSDEKLLDENLLQNRAFSIERWQNRVTFLLVKSNLENVLVTEAEPATNEVSIGPLRSTTYEFILPTEDHPRIRLENAKNDFNGWTQGILFMAVTFTAFGAIVLSFVHVLEWVDRKWIRRE